MCPAKGCRYAARALRSSTSTRRPPAPALKPTCVGADATSADFQRPTAEPRRCLGGCRWRCRCSFDHREALDLNQVTAGQFDSDGAPWWPVAAHHLRVCGVELGERVNSGQETGRLDETLEAAACGTQDGLEIPKRLPRLACDTVRNLPGCRI